MGLVLLAMRVGVHESKMYHRAKEAENTKDTIQRGNILALFTDRHRFVKYLRCIFVGLPIWFSTGILIQRTASIFGPALNI